MTDGLKVISTFQFSPTSQEVLREAANTEVACITRTDEFLSRLQEAEIICSYWMPANWRQLALHLRSPQCSSAGVDGLLSSWVLDPDSVVIVTNATALHAATMLEYVFGSIL